MSDTENGLTNSPFDQPAMQPPGPSGPIGTGGYTPEAEGPNGIICSPWTNPPVSAPSGQATPTPELGLPGPNTVEGLGLSGGESFDHDISHFTNTVTKK